MTSNWVAIILALAGPVLLLVSYSYLVIWPRYKESRDLSEGEQFELMLRRDHHYRNSDPGSPGGVLS